ncbi:MAG: MoaD/ThiS family protein [Candidatus Bathyarchaeia archaeon]
MKVEVRMLGMLKKISGRDRVSLDLDEGLRLREVIERILEEINSLKDVLLDPELRDPRPNIIVLVNGKDISVLDGLDTQIKDGDDIVFIPIIHGG